MHLLRTLAAAILALGVMPLPEATAQSARLAKGADDVVNSAMPLHLAKAKQAGSCGTNMYWKKRKCVDARDKK